jgi:hypothetical protein
MYHYTWCLDVLTKIAISRPRASQWYFRHYGGSVEALAVRFCREHDLAYRWKKCLAFIQRCLAIPGPHNQNHDQKIKSAIKYFKSTGYPHWTTDLPLGWWQSGQTIYKK